MLLLEYESLGAAEDLVFLSWRGKDVKSFVQREASVALQLLQCFIHQALSKFPAAWSRGLPSTASQIGRCLLLLIGRRQMVGLRSFLVEAQSTGMNMTWSLFKREQQTLTTCLVKTYLQSTLQLRSST